MKQLWKFEIWFMKDVSKCKIRTYENPSQNLLLSKYFLFSDMIKLAQSNLQRK